MDLPSSHPLWMWLYFGAFGTADLVLFTLVVWNWMMFNALADGDQRSAAKWNVIGFAFLFVAGWFACGIGGPLGNALSADRAAWWHAAAVKAATLSMLFTVPGWVCLLVGQRKALRIARAAKR